MKKITALIILAVVALSLFACGKQSAGLKLGMGVYSSAQKATDADSDKNGSAGALVTVATVLMDADGKIVRCVLDAAEYTFSYTADGKAVSVGEFPTKREQGDAYGMKLYGGATKEWYEQADAFSAAVTGKTVSEVKSLLASGGKGNSEVISAGCTISIEDFIFAIEKAAANASAAG